MQKEVTPFVDEEYLKLVPRLSKHQMQSLKMSIKEEGQLVPITVNQEGKILDGHTRYEICQELNLKPKFVIQEFENPLEEKMFVITSNLKRRQLNMFQTYELLEEQRKQMQYESQSLRSKKLWATRKGNKSPEPLEEKYTSSTDYRFSQMTGLGVGTIEACAYIKKHGTERLLEQVRNGTVSVNQAKVMLVKRNEFKPKTAPKPELELPPCQNCGGKTRTRRLCHVHKEYCCTICEGGK